MSANDDRVTMDQMRELLDQDARKGGLSRRINRQRFQAFLDNPTGMRCELSREIRFYYNRRTVNDALSLLKKFKVHIPEDVIVSDELWVSWHGEIVSTRVYLLSFSVDMSYEDMISWRDSQIGTRRDILSGANALEFLVFVSRFLESGYKLKNSICTLCGGCGQVFKDDTLYLTLEPCASGDIILTQRPSNDGFPVGEKILVADRSLVSTEKSAPEAG